MNKCAFCGALLEKRDQINTFVRAMVEPVKHTVSIIFTFDLPRKNTAMLCRVCKLRSMRDMIDLMLK